MPGALVSEHVARRRDARRLCCLELRPQHLWHRRISTWIFEIRCPVPEREPYEGMRAFRRAFVWVNLFRPVTDCDALRAAFCLAALCG